MGFLPIGIIFIILAVIILGTLGILCCICWSFRRLGNDRQRDEELGQSYELKSLNPQNQVDRRSKLFVEDSRGNRITKPVVLAGWLYGQEIGKFRQTLTAFFTDPEVIHKSSFIIQWAHTKIVHDIVVLIIMTSKHFWLLQCIGHKTRVTYL